MLKKDNVFHWKEQQTWSFQQIKALIAKANETPSSTMTGHCQLQFKQMHL